MATRHRAVLLLLVFGMCPASVPAGGQPPFNLVEISPGNFLHQGIHAGFDEPGHDDIANTGFIVGEQCVAVIDTGGSVTTGNELRTAIRNVTDKPVCYVINTHIHFDHVLGNHAFAEDHPEFTGHAELAGAINASREFFLREFSKYLGETPSSEVIIGPGKTVSDTLLLDLGGRTLLLTAWPKAHTYTDLTVLDQKTRTLWTGDLVFREHIPVIDGSLNGWLVVMEQLKSQDVAMIIPGHGAPGTAWSEVLGAQENYLIGLLTEVSQAVADGRFMEDVIETTGIESKDQWKLFDQHHKANVSKTFIELEWE